MPRVLVLWSRPAHLGVDEAERWARAEIRALLADRAVRSAHLTRLESASLRHGCDWNWLLELELAVPAPRCVDEGVFAEWLGDMRLLGMRPTLALVADGVADG